MSGKLREELAVKSSNFNDELPSNSIKFQETATNIDYYVCFSRFRGMASSSGLRNHTHSANHNR
jgi:hypothetical protein